MSGEVDYEAIPEGDIPELYSKCMKDQITLEKAQLKISNALEECLNEKEAMEQQQIKTNEGYLVEKQELEKQLVGLEATLASIRGEHEAAVSLYGADQMARGRLTKVTGILSAGNLRTKERSKEIEIGWIMINDFFDISVTVTAPDGMVYMKSTQFKIEGSFNPYRRAERPPRVRITRSYDDFLSFTHTLTYLTRIWRDIFRGVTDNGGKKRILAAHYNLKGQLQKEKDTLAQAKATLAQAIDPEVTVESAEVTVESAEGTVRDAEINLSQSNDLAHSFNQITRVKILLDTLDSVVGKLPDFSQITWTVAFLSTRATHLNDWISLLTRTITRATTSLRDRWNAEVTGTGTLRVEYIFIMFMLMVYKETCNFLVKVDFKSSTLVHWSNTKPLDIIKVKEIVLQILDGVREVTTFQGNSTPEVNNEKKNKFVTKLVIPYFGISEGELPESDDDSELDEDKEEDLVSKASYGGYKKRISKKKQRRTKKRKSSKKKKKTRRRRR